MTLRAWLGEHRQLLEWLGFASIVTFVASLVLLPLVVARMREDHFVRPRRPPARTPFVHVLAFVLRNTLGALLLLGGIAMLVLPGQGLLTILVGASLLDFPGKRALERRVVGRPRVLAALNWIRQRVHRPPLQPPGQDADRA